MGLAYKKFPFYLACWVREDVWVWWVTATAESHTPVVMKTIWTDKINQIALINSHRIVESLRRGERGNVVWYSYITPVRDTHSYVLVVSLYCSSALVVPSVVAWPLGTAISYSCDRPHIFQGHWYPSAYGRTCSSALAIRISLPVCGTSLSLSISLAFAWM